MEWLEEHKCIWGLSYKLIGFLYSEAELLKVKLQLFYEILGKMIWILIRK